MTAVAQARGPIPLFDLHAQHEALHDEILAAWSRLLDAGAFVNGEEVSSFEHEFASACRGGALRRPLLGHRCTRACAARARDRRRATA